MKTLSLDELRKLSKELFESNTGLTHVYATPDGQIFMPHAKNAAENHARIAGGSKSLKIHEIFREEVLEEVEEEEKSKNQLLLEKAIELELVKKEKKLYVFGETALGTSIAKSVETLDDDPELVVRITEEIGKL